jgi:predicted ArsR family transcriptional regulator
MKWGSVDTPRLMGMPAPQPAARARRTDPATSHEAAASLDYATLERLQALIAQALQSAGPLTTSELGERLIIARDSLSPRMKSLCERGIVEWTGQYRPGPSGRKQKLWRALV